MPEGPEVLHLKRALSSSITNRVVKSAEIISGRYIRNPAAIDLEALKGAQILDVQCRGKLLVFRMFKKKEFAVLSTLGMSGWWFVDEQAPYTRIQLKFEHGFASFSDIRNFGTFKVVTPQEAERKLKELGADIFEPTEFNLFQERLKRFGKTHRIAEALLDQRITAGCGNYIRADAMYLAKLNPFRTATSMTEDEIKRVWKALNQIAHEAMGEYECKIYGQSRSPNGFPIERAQDRHGRTIWYSPQELK